MQQFHQGRIQRGGPDVDLVIVGAGFERDRRATDIEQTDQLRLETEMIGEIDGCRREGHERYFGDGNDVLIADTSPNIIAKIASILIGGQALGTPVTRLLEIQSAPMATAPIWASPFWALRSTS